MRKLEITLTEEQYQHIQEEMRYAARTNLNEETFGGYSLCLQVGIPDIFPAQLEMKMANSIDLGDVEYEFTDVRN
ncbi:hypothetical protein [Salinimicrobium sp. HB62]|uniref:hypothetical protein n=1 Tax=Salinimicrobium sp. HB62 TaxID=3077781 RepID=UPI002D7761E8|nr:hypothetical protein [Salinimicrobium sp. HB62]